MKVPKKNWKMKEQSPNKKSPQKLTTKTYIKGNLLQQNKELNLKLKLDKRLQITQEQ